MASAIRSLACTLTLANAPLFPWHPHATIAEMIGKTIIEIMSKSPDLNTCIKLTIAMLSVIKRFVLESVWVNQYLLLVLFLLKSRRMKRVC